METLKQIRANIGKIMLIDICCAFFFFLLSLANFGFIVFLSLTGLILVLCIDFIIAYDFYEVAVEKGFTDTKYFWYCFITGVIGFTLVVALPNKAGASKGYDELPEL